MLRFTIRRLLTMIPSLLAISFLVFAVIELPPGDYVSNQMRELASQNDAAALARLDFMRQEFALDRPFLERYAIWAGLWPGPNGFDGLLQGQWGWSFLYQRPVAEIVGGRIGLTALLSFVTVLLVYLIAVPAALLAVRRPNGAADTAIGLFAYLGIAVPGFLLALILLYFANRWFGLTIGALMAPEFENAPLSLAKAGSVIAHLAVPAAVIALGATGVMIRRLRANLLDEMGKPYVMAARARGIGETALMVRYPLRMAIVPFVADVGSILPSLVSGAVIVSVVLNMPTLGPVLLDALRAQDTFLASFILLATAMLTLIGLALSDLILAALDPRVRLGGKAKA